MKINNESFTEPYIVTIAIPRQKTDIAFMAQAVLNYDEFDALCPRPTAPRRLMPGGEYEDGEIDEKVMLDWAALRVDWMTLKSLEVTPGLEWETVKMDQPDTWGNYQEELRNAMFSDVEIARIFGIVTDANGLSQAAIDKATEAFLVEREAQLLKENSPTVEA